MSIRLPATTFASNIARLTENFTGRQWVFDAIDRWLRESKKRFFILMGEPGIGKSAISDRLIQFSFRTEPLHPNLLPGFLSAVHRCSARDSTTVDPKNFARSITLQLAEQIPSFAQALKDVGEKQVNRPLAD